MELTALKANLDGLKSKTSELTAALRNLRASIVLDEVKDLKDKVQQLT